MADDAGLKQLIVVEQEPRLNAPIEAGFCPTCSYDLTSRPRVGRCPECGTMYHVDYLRPRPLPCAAALVGSFLWPLLLIVGVNGAFLWENYDPYRGISVLFFMALGLVLTFINSLWQGFLLAKRHAPPVSDGRRVGERLKALSGALAGLFYVMSIVPAVIVGGCLMLVCAGMMS